MPSPKVKAYGGVPANTSSVVGRSRKRENVSAFASTSRWKCMVAFGRPVVPEVNASSATSSAAVRTASKLVGCAAARRVRSSSASPPKAMTGMPSAAASRSSRNRWSHSATVVRAISWMVRSSPARSSGMVVTTTAPALSAPNQHAVSQGLFGPRSSTRLPGTTPRSSTSTCATWFAATRRSA